MKIQIRASGDYPYTKKLPPEFMRALEAEIAEHVKGYGLKDVTVEVSAAHPQVEGRMGVVKPETMTAILGLEGDKHGEPLLTDGAGRYFPAVMK